MHREVDLAKTVILAVCSDFGSLERQMFFKNAVIMIRLQQWQYSYIDYSRTENDEGQFNLLSQVYI